MLLFSQVSLAFEAAARCPNRAQFVMILDILQVALQHLDIKYTRLDGSTKTDERQMIVDEFTDDPDITVFLLSTKAGGVGINLVAASVVVIYDQDFNPHNDRQAADRAYRIVSGSYGIDRKYGLRSAGPGEGCRSHQAHLERLHRCQFTPEDERLILIAHTGGHASHWRHKAPAG